MSSERESCTEPTPTVEALSLATRTDDRCMSAVVLSATHATHPMMLLRAALGISVIVGCLETGIELQRRSGLPIPGSILGMALLLLLLQTNVGPESWVRDPSTWLLLILPALFVPLNVVPLADPDFWVRYGVRFLPIATAGAAMTLGIVAGLAWWMRPR